VGAGAGSGDLAAGSGDLAAELAADYEALRHGLGAVWVDRDVVRVGGPDSVGYLQGQLSQDIAALAVGRSAPSLLLSPQGKVDAWLRVSRVGPDEFLLDVDGGWEEAVVARLARFRLRSKVEISVVEGWQCLALRGSGVAQLLPSEIVGRPSVEPNLSITPVLLHTWTSECSAPAFWPGVVGVDLLGPSVSVPAGARLCGPDSLRALRVEAGVPAMGSELGERTIPAEAGLVEASGSFTKGCYTGQELVARLDSRGNKVPRRLRGVLVAWNLLADLDEWPEAGAELVSGEKVVGELTSVASSPGLEALVALAYVRREVTPPAELSLRWEAGSVPAQVRELPLVAGAP
jgi:folate-binding protein YgfZ